MSRIPANDALPGRRDVSLTAGKALVVLSSREQSSTWEEMIRTANGLDVAIQVGLPPLRSSAATFDAIIVDVSTANGTALEWSLSVLRRRPTSEVVLFCEDGDAPEVVALRSLGCAGLVVGPAGRDWIVAALPALVRVGEARRALQRCQNELPPLPARHGPQQEATISLPLAVAEGRFREGYILGVLARAGSRHAAAKQAGIPYRTFCKILQKLEVAESHFNE